MLVEIKNGCLLILNYPSFPERAREREGGIVSDLSEIISDGYRVVQHRMSAGERLNANASACLSAPNW